MIPATALKKPKPSSDRVQLAFELEKLHALVTRKCKRLGLFCPWGDRGTACTSMVGGSDGTLLTVYEGGYRTTLYPRMTWRLERVSVGDGSGHLGGVREALRMERASKGAVVGLVDHRPPVASLAELPRAAYLAPLTEAAFPGEVPRLGKAAGRLDRAAYLFATGQDDEARRVREEAWTFAPEWRPRGR